MKKLLFTFLACALLCPLLGAEDAENGRQKMNVKTEIWSLDSHGEIFTYISPKVDLESEVEKVPLVLALNCTTGNPEAEVRTNGWDSLCAEEKLIVVAPTYNNYATCSEVPYIKRVIDEAEKNILLTSRASMRPDFQTAARFPSHLPPSVPKKSPRFPPPAGWSERETRLTAF